MPLALSNRTKEPTENGESLDFVLFTDSCRTDAWYARRDAITAIIVEYTPTDQPNHVATIDMGRGIARTSKSFTSEFARSSEERYLSS